jgi:phosphatidylserine decarboxylase
MMAITDELLIAAMRVLPKNRLSQTMGQLARLRLPKPAMLAVLRAYVRRFGVDLAEAEHPLEAYTSVDEFFTRRLRPGARPIAPSSDAVVSPCDGEIVSIGALSGNMLLQAKGRRYSLVRFLEDSELAERMRGGVQVTIYLSPRDYHRVHAPVAGSVSGYRYIPGLLFPVSRAAVERVDELFAINERLVTVLDAPDLGPCAVGMVGAYGVGHITVAYDDIRTNQGGAEVVRHDAPSPRRVQAGDELGMFHFGSTVVLVFPPNVVELDALSVGERVRMGQKIGRKLPRNARLRVLPT